MTDVFLKAPVLAETLVTQRNPCYSAVSSTLTNPLPNYSTPTTSFSGSILHYSLQAIPFTKSLRWRLILHCCSALLQNLVGNSGERSTLRKLNNKQRHVLMFLLLLFNCHLSSLLSLFSLSLSSLCSFLNPLSSPFPRFP